MGLPGACGVLQAVPGTTLPIALRDARYWPTLRKDICCYALATRCPVLTCALCGWYQDGVAKWWEEQ
eukprot:3605056-Rhodomonas_salina.1